MQFFPILIQVLLFYISNNAGQTFKSSKDFNSDSKPLSKSVRCELQDDLVDDFYQSEHTGKTYHFKNLPEKKTATDLRSSKKVTNIAENMNIPDDILNVPELLNSTDVLAELDQMNVSIDVLKTLLNEYSSTMEGDGTRTESSDTDELVGDYESVSTTLMEQNTTTTVPSVWWKLFSTKFNKTGVKSNQTQHEGIDNIVKHLALNSSIRNQLKLKEVDVPTIALIPIEQDKVVSKDLNSFNKNQTLSKEKTVPTIRNESLQLNSLNENQPLSEEKVVSTTSKPPTFYRNQLVIDEHDFKKLAQHIIASLENIEDGIIILAKENAIISEELRTMENISEKYENYHAKERNNFVEFLKVLYNVYQNSSYNLTSTQDNMTKAVNHGLMHKKIHHTSRNNVSTERSVVIIDESGKSYGAKLNNLNNFTASTTTQRYDEDVGTSDIKYKMVIVGNNENKTIQFFKNDSVGDSRTNNTTSRRTFDTVLGNVIDVIKKGFPESHPTVIEYETKNNG